MAIAAFAHASLASDPARSRGRRFAERDSATRSAFRRDCDRIIHSAAFRRLAHKTQGFVFHEGDHFRTRLTHTLEVTQIARSLGRALGLDEDLAEASALGHDLGHPPFGHAGERALDQCLAAFGGFDHNAQTLHVVTDLEGRYADFDGLNLTWERLEPGRHAHELMRRLITRMIEGVIAESRRRIAGLDPASPDAVRNAGRPVVGFSAAMAEADRAIKNFLYPRLYRHARIMRIMGAAEEVVRRLFAHYVEAPGDMPADWLSGIVAADAKGRALRIADFIAGMTDRYAMV